MSAANGIAYAMSNTEHPAVSVPPARPERRLAAILSVSVHDYSRLMGEDEEATLRTLMSYRAVITTLIQQHCGRVVDSPGDNLLAEFASAVDAVQGAVAMQRELFLRNEALPSPRRLHYRIGINVGDVIVKEGRLYGDGVNIAARMASVAKGGEICLSGSVYDQVERKLPFPYHALGEQQMKNIAKPVRVYQIATFSAEAARDQNSGESEKKEESQESKVGEQPSTAQHVTGATQFAATQHSTLGAQHSILVGRDTELAKLQQYFAQANSGRRQLVLISGEPGIGKSALVEAFLAQVREREQVREASGQCVEQYGPGEAYLPLLDATARLCRGPAGERRLEALKQYAPSWAVQLPALVNPEELARLQPRVQGANRDRMLREMAEAAELFASQRCLVVVLEDLHWSDTATLEWLTYVSRRCEPARLLILGTYRPMDAAASGHPLKNMVHELCAHKYCEELQLTPLPEPAVQDYLAQRFPGMLVSAALTNAVHSRTGGNPLFLKNIVNHLIEQGVMVGDEENRLVASDLRTVENAAPTTLRHLIEQQLERLDKCAQSLLEVASIGGVEFSVASVAVGLQQSLESLEDGCEQLARQGRFLTAQGLEEWPNGVISGRYRFTHALYHEAVYERVALSRRVRLHRLIAEHKEAAYGERLGEIAGELAAHYEQGQDLIRAVQYHERAGKTAMRRSAHQEAIAHLRKGLALLETLPDSRERDQQELALSIALGASLMVTKGYTAPEVEQVYARARELCQRVGEPAQLSSAISGLATFVLLRGEFEKASELGKQLLRLAQQEGEAALFVEAHCILGMSFFHLGELGAAQAHLQQGMALHDAKQHRFLAFRYGQDPGVFCRSYLARLLWFLGYPEQALHQIEEAMALAQELDHSFSSALALSLSAVVSQLRREAQATQAQAARALALSAENDFAFYAAMGTVLQGWALTEQGKREEGITGLQQGLAAWQATGAQLFRPHLLALLAESYGKVGRVTEGLAVLDNALAAAHQSGRRFYEAELYRLRGELTLQTTVDRRPSTVAEEAEASFLTALEIARQQDAKSWELRAATSLARLWRQQDKEEEARELLQKVFDWFTEGFDTKDLRDAAALLRELGGSTRKAEAGKGHKVVSSQHAVASREREASPTSHVSHLTSQVEEQLPTTHHARHEQSPHPQDSVLSPKNASSPVPDPHSPLPNTFRYEGEHWVLTFAGEVCRMDDTLGLHYLAQLLQHQHQELSAVTLATNHEVVSSPAGAADKNKEALPISQLAAADRQRVTDLQEELAEARNFHDLGRIERVQEELETLARQLTQSLGDKRKTATPGEQVRVNVTRAIRRTLQKIATLHPTLGEYLRQTVKTGAICVYHPDPEQSVMWRFS